MTFVTRKILGELMYYLEQEVRAGRNVVRVDPANRRTLAEMIKNSGGSLRVGGLSLKNSKAADMAQTNSNAGISVASFEKAPGEDTVDKQNSRKESGQCSFLSVVPGKSKLEKFEEIKKIISLQGKQMGLEKCRDKLVFPVGNLEARLAFVGEAPGAEEELQGQPFVGKAGELLTKMIVAMGLRREDVFICNVLLRRPSVGPVTDAAQVGNRPPTLAEMAADRAQLMTFLDLVRPDVVVCLGLTAVRGLLAMPDATMSHVRGRWHEIRDPIPVVVMPTYHPSYLLRNQSISEKRKVWEDLMMVMERLGMEVSEKQRAYFTRV